MVVVTEGRDVGGQWFLTKGRGPWVHWVLDVDGPCVGGKRGELNLLRNRFVLFTYFLSPPTFSMVLTTSAPSAPSAPPVASCCCI